MAAMAGDITPRDGDAATDHATLPRILCVTVPGWWSGDVRCAGFDSGHNGLSPGARLLARTLCTYSAGTSARRFDRRSLRNAIATISNMKHTEV
jgi:hypothetical protein